MKNRYKTTLALAALCGSVYLFNASWLAPVPTGDLTVWSHRGVHQRFSLEGVENDTCTASMIEPPTHDYMENTLPSMRAAIDAGAGMIELDIHPTTDGHFVVFHDWTLDCRTNGTGKTRDHTLVELKALDIGYGYTADGGKTWPFRGRFIGAMPTLDEVFDAFPETHFFINIKSRSRAEAAALAAWLDTRTILPGTVLVYGHPDPIETLAGLNLDIRTLTKQAGKDCLVGYIKTGWFGKVPKVCHGTFVGVPENYRWAIWGWPNRFQSRFAKVGSRPILYGPITKARADPLIDTLEQLDSIPKGFSGIVATNRIEIVGPALKGREVGEHRVSTGHSQK